MSAFERRLSARRKKRFDTPVRKEAESEGPDPVVSGKVCDFLERIRGLNSLPPGELQELLYARRFELLGPLNTSPRKGGKADKDKLPEYSKIPNQFELHETLVSGVIPAGYQCVAHVLYPESVAWPIHGRRTSVTGEEEDKSNFKAPSLPTAAEMAAIAAAIDAKQSKPTDEEEEAKLDDFGDDAPKADAPLVSMKPAAGKQRHSIIAEGPDYASEASQGSEESTEVKKDHGRLSKFMLGLPQTKEVPASDHHFVLCGQKVASTIRGKAVQEPTEDVMANYMKAADDERYNEARHERIKLEHAVKLEQYQERKLLEKIRNLEILREAEVCHQKEIKARESERVARKAELKKELEEAWAVKLAKEREEKELEKQSKEKEVVEQKKWQEYHKKQKQVVREWQSNRASTPQGSDEGLASQTPEQVAKEKEAGKERERRLRPKTVKAQLAEEKVQALRQAQQQRPPLPPRSHDLASPVADLLEDSQDSAARAPAPKGPVSWSMEAKRVSNYYGLTPRDCAAVENRVTRNVQGAGRMAQYERI